MKEKQIKNLCNLECGCANTCMNVRLHDVWMLDYMWRCALSVDVHYLYRKYYKINDIVLFGAPVLVERVDIYIIVIKWFMSSNVNMYT